MQKTKSCLFLFTKEFPYGNMEAYISNELPYLANEFEKVVIVPADFFQYESVNNRALPANVQVLPVNKQINDYKKRRLTGTFEMLSILVREFFSTSLKAEFIQHFKKHVNVLRHQQAMANAFAVIFKNEYSFSKNYFYSYWMHNAVLLLSLLKRRKVIDRFFARAHSIDLYHEHWTGKNSFKKIPLPVFPAVKWIYTDKVFPVSEHGASFLRKKYPAGNKVYCSYLGVPDTAINPWKDESAFTIVSAAWLSSNKRLRYMPDILKKISFPVQWVHFGEGEEKNIIEEKVKKLPPNVRVTLMGNVSKEEIMTFYSNHTVHLFINLSEAEGLPVTLMEAASFGIPMLATAVYGTPEIVIPGETGLLVSKNFTAEEIAKTITDFHNNPVLQGKLRKGAREHFLKKFNASLNYPGFIHRIKDSES